MDKRKRLGLNPELYCLPLFHGLTEKPEFECTVDVVAKNAIKMRGHDLDAAFLSPIDYARESSDYCIIPNVAVASRTPGNAIVLGFKEGLQTVSTLAVSPTSTSEIVLAMILLGERFDVRPRIVPVMGPIDQMLASADAALLVGNAAIDHLGNSQNTLDLVELWNDLTDLPYVHGFWCARESTIAKPDIKNLQQARDRGVESLDAIIQAGSVKYSPDVLKNYLENFSFAFGEDEQDGLMEFLRFAYYHGILPDVADLNFYPMDKEDESPFDPASLN